MKKYASQYHRTGLQTYSRKKKLIVKGLKSPLVWCGTGLKSHYMLLNCEDWPPVSSDREHPSKSRASSETGIPGLESHSHVSVLETVTITATIGHSNYWLHMNTFTSVEWMNQLQSDQCLWSSTSPDFRELQVPFPAKSEDPLACAWL